MWDSAWDDGKAEREGGKMRAARGEINMQAKNKT